MTLPPELRARVLAAIEAEPAPTRAEHRQKSIRALGLGVGAAMLVMFATGGPDPGHRTASFFVLSAFLLVVVSSALTVVALRGFGKSMSRAPAELLVGLALATAPVMWTLEFAMRIVWPQPYAHAASLQSSILCHLCTFAMALGPFVALMVMRRGNDPSHPRAMGAAIGATAGAWAAVLIDLHCGSSDLRHIALAHLLPVMLLAGLGAL
ncbi:MAG: NrsF family protein, partial [Polyangiaceae bacterium]